jgi:hypothetical protein
MVLRVPRMRCCVVLGVVLAGIFLFFLLARRGPVERVFAQIEIGMTEAQLRQLDGFENVFDFKYKTCNGFCCRAGDERDRNWYWTCDIEVNHDGVVIDKSWKEYVIGEDTPANRMFGQLLNSIDPHPFRRYKVREGRTLAF